MFRIVSPPETVYKILESICEKHKDIEHFGENGGIKLDLVSQNSPVDLTHVDKSGFIVNNIPANLRFY